jgi:FkbM family methyltransferase
MVRGAWQRIRPTKAVKRLRNIPALHALAAPFWYGQNVDQYGTFVARELTRRLRPDRSPAKYTLRSQELSVRIRHNDEDAWILEDIFGRKIYEPPASAAALLPRDSDLTLLDMGGHIGLFAVFALARWPRSKVISFEPDPHNIAVLKQCIADNAIVDRWTWIEAAASTSNGTLTFLSVGDRRSRIASISPGDGKLIKVAAIDIFDWFGQADLVKMDIEGGEWPILMDDRFGVALPQIFVLEYHPQGCPGPDSYGAVRDRLTHLGYEIERMPDQNDYENAGQYVGIVWAWRPPSPRSAGNMP